jgi:hypothetical protein
MSGLADYLLHPRSLLLVFPLLGAFGPAMWVGLSEGKSAIRVLGSALTQWTTLLVGGLLNLLAAAAIGAIKLRDYAREVPKS